MEDEELNIKLSHKLENDKALEFLLGGNSWFSVKNITTGNHMSYKVVLSNKSQKPIYFVKAKNEFIGTLFDKNKFVYSKKSDLSIDSPEVKGFAFVFYHLIKKTLPKNVEIWHNGKCGRCGKPLTDPESVARGIGKHCLEASLSGDGDLKAAVRGKKKLDKEYDRIVGKVKYY